MLPQKKNVLKNIFFYKKKIWIKNKIINQSLELLCYKKCIHWKVKKIRSTIFFFRISLILLYYLLDHQYGIKCSTRILLSSYDFSIK